VSQRSKSLKGRDQWQCPELCRCSSMKMHNILCKLRDARGSRKGRDSANGLKLRRLDVVQTGKSARTDGQQTIATYMVLFKRRVSLNMIRLTISTALLYLYSFWRWQCSLSCASRLDVSRLVGLITQALHKFTSLHDHYYKYIALLM
jgi:hypothetical protein